METESVASHHKNWWTGTPLYVRILLGFAIGIVLGLSLGERAHVLDVPSKLVLRLLGALAPALILVAVIQALMKAELPKGSAGRLISLLLMNTCVAILIGLLVANILKPGARSHIPKPTTEVKKTGTDAFAHFLENIPKSLAGPFGDDGKILGVVIIAVGFGIALRTQRHRAMPVVSDLIDLALSVLIRVLHWIIEAVPIAVLGIVASIVGKEGLKAFISLGWFVVAVLIALALQVGYYLLRIRMGSWVRPMHALRSMRDALVMAFSTGSSTATMPLTFECLYKRVGLRERSASLGGLVGANFNNDGTALYEAMSALFVSQLLGQHLTVGQQLLVVLTSIIASVGAAGIPEAGLVTMTLVFKAVDLPTYYIAILLPVDWFLDRCRTAVNVMGDVNVSCLLDGRTPEDRSLQTDSPASITPVG